MKTILITAFAAFLSTNLLSQDVYMSKTGKLSFFSEAPLENIDAASEKTTSILNIKTNKFAAKVAMKSFVFQKPLMQEHFNENYMESEKFPFGKLDCIITDTIDYTKDGTYNVTAKGTLDIHGVPQEREIKGTLTIKEGKISIKSEFQVKVADHKIEIPQLVIQNIAEVIDVKYSADFELYVKGKE